MNYTKQIQKEMFDRAFAENPALLEAKRNIGLLMAAAIGSRGIYILVEIILSVQRSLPYSPMNLVGFCIGCLFAFAVYGGAKPLLWLMLVGGLYSVFQLFVPNGEIVLQNLLMGDWFYNLYIFLLIAVCLLQAGISIYALANKRFDAYFQKAKEITRESQAMGKR